MDDACHGDSLQEITALCAPPGSATHSPLSASHDPAGTTGIESATPTPTSNHVDEPMIALRSPLFGSQMISTPLERQPVQNPQNIATNKYNFDRPQTLPSPSLSPPPSTPSPLPSATPLCSPASSTDQQAPLPAMSSKHESAHDWSNPAPRQSARIAMRSNRDLSPGSAIPIDDSCEPTKRGLDGGEDSEDDVPLAARKAAKAALGKGPARKKRKSQGNVDLRILHGAESADIVLVCKTGEKFWVNAAVLLAHWCVSTLSPRISSVTDVLSALFRDALHLQGPNQAGKSLTSPQGPAANEELGENVPPIELDYDCKTITDALWVMYGRPLTPTTSIETITDLLRLAEFLGAHLLINHLETRLLEHVRTTPWDVFVIAAQLDKLHLAKLCLGNMYLDGKYAELGVASLIGKVSAPLPRRWSDALFVALHTYPPGSGKVARSVQGLCERWRAISAEYDPYAEGEDV